MGVNVSGARILDTGCFNLLEAPLGKVDRSGTEVAAEFGVSQSERSGQSSDAGSVGRRSVADNFDLPVVLLVTNSHVTVAGHFPVGFGDRRCNSM